MPKTKALEKQTHDLQNAFDELRTNYNDLVSRYKSLKADADRDFNGASKTIATQGQKIADLSSRSNIELSQRPQKPYHSLSISQKGKVNKQIKDKFGPKLNKFLQKRKLEFSSLTLEDADDNQKNVEVRGHKRRKFDELKSVEMSALSQISDQKVVSRLSAKDYARIRSLCSSLPPSTHIKSYEESVAPNLPKVEQAPNFKEGGFCDLVEERNTQIEHLESIDVIHENKVIYVKPGIDATRMTHQNSACVYTLTTLTRDGWDIGAVGLVSGGDHYGDMKDAAKSYFAGVKSIAENNEVTVRGKKVKTQVVIGGDMSNTLELYGLSNATSTYPCMYCNVPKSMFLAICKDPEMWVKCNKTGYESANGLARSRAQIINEATKSKPGYGVKGYPLCPLPLNPHWALIYVLLICFLHLRLRVTGT